MTRTHQVTRRIRPSGFTLLEVMMALAVMTIGGSALIGMQAMTARFNTQSRQTAIATDIAQTWAERLKQDAVSWNLADPLGLVTTTWIRDADVGINTWMMPVTAQMPVALPWRTPAFDRYGRDVDPTVVASIFYCVAYRFIPVVPAVGARTPSMRVDIRVFWPREGTGSSGTCITADGMVGANYHSVGLPIVVRRGILPDV